MFCALDKYLILLQRSPVLRFVLKMGRNNANELFYTPNIRGCVKDVVIFRIDVMTMMLAYRHNNNAMSEIQQSENNLSRVKSLV